MPYRIMEDLAGWQQEVRQAVMRVNIRFISKSSQHPCLTITVGLRPGRPPSKTVWWELFLPSSSFYFQYRTALVKLE